MSPRMRRLTAREGVNPAESTQRIPAPIFADQRVRLGVRGVRKNRDSPQVGARENRGSPFLSKTFIAWRQNRVYYCILGCSVPNP
jgi:hypothetical protein